MGLCSGQVNAIEACVYVGASIHTDAIKDAVYRIDSLLSCSDCLHFRELHGALAWTIKQLMGLHLGTVEHT